MIQSKKDKLMLAEAYDRVYLEEAPAPKQAAPQPPAPAAKEDADDIQQQAKPAVDALNAEEEDEELEDLGGSMGDIEQYEQTDLPSFNYKALYTYIMKAYHSKGSLLIYGEPGLGKSTIVINQAKQIAKTRNRVFVEWNKASNEHKKEIIANPAKYFCLVDVRVNKLEPMDFVGIPDIGSKDPYLETKQFKWIYFLSQPEADGILFLDEINQGSPETLRALFEVVLDKSFGGTKMSDNICVIGAGNLGQDYEQPIPPALTARFSVGVLIPDPEAWLEWAESAGIDRRIIAFVKSDPGENFYKKPKGPDDPFPTPRQLHRLSDGMKHWTKTFIAAKKKGENIGVSLYKAIGDEAATLCGVYWARKFVTFLKHIRSFDFKKIISEIDSLSKTAADKLHALVVFVVGKLRLATSAMLKSPGQTPPDSVEILEGN